MSEFDFDRLRRERGGPAHRIDKARYWELLELMPPGREYVGDTFDAFMVSECWTADLYYWGVRVGAEYWGMVAPESSTPRDLMARIQKARGEYVSIH